MTDAAWAHHAAAYGSTAKPSTKHATKLPAKPSAKPAAKPPAKHATKPSIGRQCAPPRTSWFRRGSVAVGAQVVGAATCGSSECLEVLASGVPALGRCHEIVESAWRAFRQAPAHPRRRATLAWALTLAPVLYATAAATGVPNPRVDAVDAAVRVRHWHDRAVEARKATKPGLTWTGGKAAARAARKAAAAAAEAAHRSCLEELRRVLGDDPADPGHGPGPGHGPDPDPSSTPGHGDGDPLPPRASAIHDDDPLPPRASAIYDGHAYDAEFHVAMSGEDRPLLPTHRRALDALQTRGRRLLARATAAAVHPSRKAEARALNEAWSGRVGAMSARYELLSGRRMATGGADTTKTVFVGLHALECLPKSLARLVFEMAGMVHPVGGAAHALMVQWLLDLATVDLKWTVELGCDDPSVFACSVPGAPPIRCERCTWRSRPGSCLAPGSRLVGSVKTPLVKSGPRTPLRPAPRPRHPHQRQRQRRLTEDDHRRVLKRNVRRATRVFASIAAAFGPRTPAEAKTNLDRATAADRMARDPGATLGDVTTLAHVAFDARWALEDLAAHLRPPRPLPTDACGRPVARCG